LFFDTINAYQRTEALRAAIELDLFSLVAAGRQTATELANACQAAPRGIRMQQSYHEGLFGDTPRELFGKHRGCLSPNLGLLVDDTSHKSNFSSSESVGVYQCAFCFKSRTHV